MAVNRMACWLILSNTELRSIDFVRKSEEGPLELRQLRYFVAVAEELHFRRAAQRLHISQPPLSHQIAALETELGCQLLARTRRSVRLTPAGASFLRDARTMLAELDAAASTARAIDAGQVGRLRVSFVGSALTSVVPAVVQRFRLARPGVEIELRERSTVQQLRALDDDVIDVGLIRGPAEVPPSLVAWPVLRERTVCVLPADHELAALRRVPLRRLAAHPLVMFPREQAPGFHDLIIARLAAAGLPPRVVQYAPEMLTIIGLVAAGIGVSLVPASLSHLALDGVAYRPIVSAPDAELLAVVRGDDRSPLLEAFLADGLGAAR